MSDFKQLQVWQKAHALSLHVHRVATTIRHSSDLALRAQMIRSAMSIAANIVEGRRQSSEKEFARFLRIAINSGCELEYHLIVANDVGGISDDDGSALLRELIEVRKMLHGLLRKVDATTAAPNVARPRTPV